MVDKLEGKLEQTKGTFKLIGKVVNIDRENAYNERKMTDGKNKGKDMRTLRFGIQTSPDNIVQVSVFSFLPEEVYVWNTTKKSGNKMDYKKWLANRTVLEKKKIIPLQTRIGLKRDSNGKSITQHLPSYDAMEYLNENLFNGDSVVVEGDNSFNTYTTKSGDTVTSTNHNITSLFLLKKPVDFEDEKFEEVSLFTQEFVFDSADVDSEQKMAMVYGKSIAYNQTVTDVNFEIHFENDEDGAIERMAKTYSTKVPFGSLLKVHGNIVNRAISGFVESDDDEDDDVLAMLGGEKNRMEATVTYKRYLEILGTDSMESEKYTEEELYQNDDKLVEKESGLGDLGGKSSNKDKSKDEDFLDDDFEDDFDDDFDDSDDDLPF